MHEIAAEKYVQITTFTKDGRPKTAPVWIADLGEGAVGFTTGGASWKARRIRSTPKVELRASDSRGRVESGAETATGSATLGQDAEFERADAAIRAKYGWQVPMIGAVYRIGRLFGRGHVTDTGVVITLD
jgi:PPOX class probable F420-dependent enzyme